MSVPYTPQIDEIDEVSPQEGASIQGRGACAQVSDELSDDDTGVGRSTAQDEDNFNIAVRELQYVPRSLTDTPSPKRISALMVGVGSVIVILGIFQIIIVPLIENSNDSYVIDVSKRNCFGLSLWCGILLLFTGCVGLRASMRQHFSTVYSFFVMTLLSSLVYVVAFLLIIIGYSSGWTVASAYPAHSALYPLHIGVSVTVGVGLVVCIMAFTQYYEDVFCGQWQLCKKCVHCIMPCWCPKVSTYEEMLQEDNRSRPPSLPV